MKSFEEEAIEYVINHGGNKPETFTDEQIGRLHGYIDGANSKWVQAEKIKAQMDILNSFYYGDDLKDKDIMKFYSELHAELTEELEQQLKELEDYGIEK